MKQEINYKQMYLNTKVGNFVSSFYDFWESFKVYKNQVISDYPSRVQRLFDFYDEMEQEGYEEREVRNLLIEILKEKEDDLHEDE